MLTAECMQYRAAKGKWLLKLELLLDNTGFEHEFHRKEKVLSFVNQYYSIIAIPAISQVFGY